MNTENPSLEDSLRRIAENAIKSFNKARPSRFDPSGIVVKKDLLKIFFASDKPDLRERIALEHQILSDLSSIDLPETFDIEFIFRNSSEQAETMRQGTFDKEPPSGALGSAGSSGPFGTTMQRRAIPGVQKIVALASGKGGVGKTTTTAHLALAAASQGAKVGILDADFYGPSIPLLFELFDKRVQMAGQEKDKKLQAIDSGFLNLKLMSFGFLADQKSPAMWRGPILAKALETFFFDVAWGDLDLLLVDLPPGTGDTQLTLVEKLPLHHVILVTTPQGLALADAQRALSMFEKLEIPVLGIVCNMHEHSCSACGHRDHPFGRDIEEFASDNQLNILAKLPIDPKAQSLPLLRDGKWEDAQWQALARQVRSAPLNLGPRVQLPFPYSLRGQSQNE